MMRNVAFGLGVAAWAALVFVVTFYVTFPSEALVQRIEEEAPRVLGPNYEVDLASAAPWWVGVSMTDVAVSQRPRNWRRDPAAESTLVAFAPKARVRASLFSLLRQAPYVVGAVTLGDGRVDFDVATQAGERQLQISALDVEADQLPLADLLGSPVVASALGGFSMVGDGAVDLEVDLRSGERGMADGVGRVALTGSGLMLSEIVSETTGPLGIDVPIKELDIVAEVDEGKGEVKKGLIDSDLFKLEISGDFGLRDPLSNSTINLEIELSDISKDLSIVETMLRTAVGPSPTNGAYKFNCRGMVSRLNSRSCRLAGGRASRGSSSRGRPEPRVRPTAANQPRPAPTRPSTNDADRERRREEIRERLRARSRGVEAEEDEEEFLDEEEEDLDDLPDPEMLADELRELGYDDFDDEE